MVNVSVIIPYYKKKKYIKKTIVSVIKQTYKNFEAIIVYDDEDRSELEYIKSIISSDKRLRLIVNPKNVGAGISRNIGIKFSKGKFISFLDADDLWFNTKLEKQLQFLEKTKSDICHTSYYIIDSHGKIKGFRKARNHNTYTSLLKSCDIGLSTVLIKKKIFTSKNLKFPNLKTKEDFVLWLKILKKKYKIIGYDKNLVKWRMLKNSLSASTFQKLLDGFRVYNNHMHYSFVRSIYLLLCLGINFLRKKC